MKFIHALALLCSLLEHHAHVHVEHEFEMVLAHLNPRRSIIR